MHGTRPRTPNGVSNLAVSLDSQNVSPVDGSDLVVFLDVFPKVGKTTRAVIRLHLSLRRPSRAGPRRAVTGGRPDFGTRPAAMLRRTRPGRASACDRLPGFGTRPGFGAHDRAGVGTPLPQLIPRRRVGLCRFPRFVSKSWQDHAHGQLVSSRES